MTIDSRSLENLLLPPTQLVDVQAFLSLFLYTPV